jgi:hypothetical protein
MGRPDIAQTCRSDASLGSSSDRNHPGRDRCAARSVGEGFDLPSHESRATLRHGDRSRFDSLTGRLLRRRRIVGGCERAGRRTSDAGWPPASRRCLHRRCRSWRPRRPWVCGEDRSGFAGQRFGALSTDGRSGLFAAVSGAGPRRGEFALALATSQAAVGWKAMMLNTAPCGSLTTENLPGGMSVGGTITLPPSSSTRAAAASQFSTPK